MVLAATFRDAGFSPDFRRSFVFFEECGVFMRSTDDGSSLIPVGLDVGNGWSGCGSISEWETLLFALNRCAESGGMLVKPWTRKRRPSELVVDMTAVP